MATTTRRNAIRRGLAAIAGVAGLGAAGMGGRDPADAPRRAAVSDTVLEFYARVVSVTPGRGSAGLARRGDRSTAHAELFDRAGGKRLGELHGATFTLRGPGAPTPAGDRLEIHTFVLGDGTMVGSGVGAATEGEFAIVGGTGRYVGVRGAYTVRRAGDEGAHLVVTLIA